MSDPVQSPITGEQAIVSDEVRCADLIDRYRNDWGLDVATHFTGMHSLSLYRCKDTGYRFFHPQSLAGEAAFYDEFWALENPTIHRPKGVLRDDWQYALNRVQPGEKLLDVGCADGTFLESAGRICDARGIDENERGCELAQSNGLNVTCSTVSDYAETNFEAFDTIAASQVLEHVYDVAKFMEALKRLVRPGGRLILSVPNNEPYYVGWAKYEPLNNPPHHIGLWNEGSLRRMAEHFGLGVEEVQFLGRPERFVLQVYRRAAYLAGVTKSPNQLRLTDWLKIVITTPLATLNALVERLTRSTCNYAYLSIILRKP